MQKQVRRRFGKWCNCFLDFSGGCFISRSMGIHSHLDWAQSFLLRNLINAICLALMAAGPIPLAVHHYLDHAGSGVGRPSTDCRQCACGQHVDPVRPQGGDESSKPIQDDCQTCFQLAQLVLPTNAVQVDDGQAFQGFAREEAEESAPIENCLGFSVRGPPTAV
jgi:hypothetical protein